MNIRYSSLKVFRFPEKLRSLPRSVSEILPPLHIRIKPTNICAHHCRYCAYRAPDLQLGRSMQARDAIPRDKMVEIMEDVIAMNVRAVTFSGGGEPLGYPHIIEILEMLAASPVRFAALTNGAALAGRVAEVMARAGTWVRVSLDGWDAQSYAQYRGVGTAAFGRLLRNMENFKSLGGRCHLGVSLIVDGENAPHVGEIIRTVHGAGADSIKISPCIISDDEAENNRFHAPLFGPVQDQIAGVGAGLHGDRLEIHNMYHPHEVRFEKPYEWCPYAQILPVIGADLGVYTCQDKAYNRDSGLLGFVRDTRLRDFWFAEKEKFFTVRPCADCRHHCVADAKNRLVLEYLSLDEEHLGFV